MMNEQPQESRLASNATIEQINARLGRQFVAVSVLFLTLAAAILATSSVVERRLPHAVYAALALLYFLVLVALLLQARTARRQVHDFIAEQSEAMREAALLAQLVRLLTNAANTPYWIWRPGRAEFELHGPWAQHAGIEGHTLSHEAFFDSVISRDSVEQVFRDAQAHVSPVSRILARDLGDGATLTTVATFIPVRRANNDLLAMIGTSVDIDSQLKSQKALDSATNESRALRAFLAAFCATLGEHANVSASAIDRLRANAPSNAAADIALVAAGSRELRHLVEDATEMVQVQAMSQSVSSEVPLAAVFDIAVRQVVQHAPPFRIEAQPILPADRPVQGDPEAVQRIFEILIFNAVALASLDSALSATVRIRCALGATCKIEIVSVGPKASPQDLFNLSEPFYRGSMGNRIEPGAMKIAIARALANANGAMLTLGNSSADEEGLVATVEFPLAGDHD